MKKAILSLLALTLLLLAAVPALGEEQVTLTVNNAARLPLYEAGDPALEGLAAADESGLPVLVLPVRKSLQIQAAVQPQSVKNKRFTLSVEDGSLAQVRGNSVLGTAPGETVLTVASEADPSVTVQYRLAVIQQVTRLTLTSSEKSVSVGETVTVTPAFQPENVTCPRVVWSSADEKIATVDAEGRVTGVKRGNARIIATTTDGSNIRANIGIQVLQPAGEIQLDKTEASVDVKRSIVLKATVLPAETNDKKVIWSSSDENVATVNNQGRVTGVGLGECEIICTSASDGTVTARAAVRVTQPVQSVTFDAMPAVYAGEPAQLSWHVEPENASNPVLQFTSGNEKVLTVSEDGTVTGIKSGEAWVNAVTTDGSNRRARVKVKVGEHVTGVEMKRNTAYIDLGASSTTGAVLTPKNATNTNMTWEIADPSVASVEPLKKQPWRVSLKGLSEGQTVLTGTTEDGGYQASMTVLVGSFENSLQLVKNHTYVDSGSRNVVIRVQNVSGLTITSVTAEVTVTDGYGDPVPCSSKDDGNTFTVVYRGTLGPGDTTRDSGWKYVNYSAPDFSAAAQFEVRITQFQIDNDWVKVIRRNRQPVKKCPVNQ